MYNKKSATAATKYTKGLFTESGPKSKMASRNGGGDDPKKSSASTSDSTRDNTLKFKEREPETVEEVNAKAKEGRMSQKERVAAKLKILGPKEFKKRYGYLPETTEKPNNTYERPEYVPGKKKDNEKRVFLEKQLPEKEALTKRRQVTKEFREGIRSREDRKKGMDSTWTEKGLMKADKQAAFDTKVRKVKNKVKKVCDKIDKATGRARCHWVGQF
jgi:hypothetical protein